MLARLRSIETANKIDRVALTRIIENPALYLLLVLILGLYVQAPNNFISFSDYVIGEAYEAFHGALNISTFGWKWAGLQDEATNSSPAAHPFLYLHHGNIGLYVSYFLLKMGVRTLGAQNALSVIPFLAGLYIAYVFFSGLAGSRLPGIFFLALVCFDFSTLSTWGFNVHRSFTYLAFFGCLLVHSRVVRRDQGAFASGTYLALSALVLLYLDYLYYFYTFFLLLLMQPTVYLKALTRGKHLRLLVLVGIAFGLAFGFRQIQVMAGVGVNVWETDFLYQILNRLPLQHFYHGNLSHDTAHFYASHGIYDPVSYNLHFRPSVGWGERLHRYAETVGRVFSTHLASWRGVTTRAAFAEGITILTLTLAGGAVALLSGVWPHALRSASLVLNACAWSYSMLLLLSLLIFAVALTQLQEVGVSLMGLFVVVIAFLLYWLFSRRLAWREERDAVTPEGARLGGFSLAALTSAVAMYAIFSSYFVDQFEVYNLDVICVMIWTVTALTVAHNSSLVPRKWPSAILLVLLLLKSGAIAPYLATTSTGMGDYAVALGSLKGHTVVSNFTPAAVASYTRTFSAKLRSNAIPMLAQHRAPSLSDYDLFAERDRDNPLYRHPEYFVLFLQFASPDDLFAASGLPIVTQGRSFILFRLEDLR